MSQDAPTTSDKRKTVNGKARHAIVRKSMDALATTTISVDNDGEQIRVDHLAKTTKSYLVVHVTVQL